MKKITTLTIAMGALLFFNISANAQNSGYRNMEKRNQVDQNNQYSHRTNQYDRRNENDQHDKRNERYSRNNQNGQYGRQEERFNNHHPVFIMDFYHRGHEYNDRYYDHDRKYEHNRGRDNDSYDRRRY